VSKLRISVVQYFKYSASCAWLHARPLQGKYDLSFTVPSLCADALRTGAADVAIIPAIEYQRIPNLVILPDLSIASKERVRSLLIVSKDSIRRAKRIALDRSSRSTQALTKILCANRWNITPEFREAEPDVAAMLQESDAALLIGDPALRLAISAESKSKTWPRRRMDLRRRNRRPPAVSLAPHLRCRSRMVANDRTPRRPCRLGRASGNRYRATRRRISLIAGIRARESRRHLQGSFRRNATPEKELKLYLKTNIDYSLDDENRKGLLAYYFARGELGLIGKLNPSPSPPLRRSRPHHRFFLDGTSASAQR